ncbi:MAG: PilN domain-containing protein [Anaerolineaceae bacterium]|nr:PilN domain-containing protein [Anaerolineaceae bacterium]
MDNIANNYEEDTQEAPQQHGSRLVIWLIALSLGALFLPLYLVSSSIQEETGQLTVTLAALEGTLAVTPQPAAQEQALQDTLLQLRGQINEMQPVITGLQTSKIDWLHTFAVVGTYDTTRMTLTAVSQTENRLVLTGQATSETDVMTYFQMLDESLIFDRVIVQSIILRDMTGSQATAKPVIRDNPPIEEVPVERMSEFNIMLELKVGEDG